MDECHRGHLLDREMSDAETAFRDVADHVSKYRRALEHFDPVKIGLTATPALHIAEIFGEPIYRYSYRDAVIDGRLVDHDPPHLIRTTLSAEGIHFDAGADVETLDTATGEIDTAQLEDRIDFDVQHFNRKVIAPEFNRAVAEEIATRIAVTVDLLTTGIDVSAITNLVFLRRVNSRILYDQMIGRATRLCPDIGKEVV